MSIISLIFGNTEFKNRLEQLRPRLYRLAYSWSHNTSLADDLVQEAMMKALKNSNQLRDPLLLNSWLFSIMANCWRDHFRHHRETEDVDDIEEFHFSHNITPEFTHAQSQIVARVRSAVEMLPLAHRQVVTLVDLEEFSYIEVASILNIPIGTVMSRLCRARSKMKELLNEFAPQNKTGTEKIRRIK